MLISIFANFSDDLSDYIAVVFQKLVMDFVFELTLSRDGPNWWFISHQEVSAMDVSAHGVFGSFWPMMVSAYYKKSSKGRNLLGPVSLQQHNYAILSFHGSIKGIS